MGFLDYAGIISLQKDNKETKILFDPRIKQPTLERDTFGFNIKLPKIDFLEDKNISYVGQKFPATVAGKAKMTRLFRASVLHLTAHTMIPLPDDVNVPQRSDSVVEAFVKSLARDMCIDAYLRMHHSDKCYDIAYSNALVFRRLKPLERIISSSTRIMTASLSIAAFGQVKGFLAPAEQQIVNEINQSLTFNDDSLSAFLSGTKTSIPEVLRTRIAEAVSLMEPFGPFVEAPSLPYTEQIGHCSIFSEMETDQQDKMEFERVFWQILQLFGCSIPENRTLESCWKKEQSSEALQAFDSEIHEEERRQKILSKIEPYASHTKFKSVGFPEEDYTQYLRAKNLVRGTSRRLLDILRSAMDYMDEDSRREMGQLDLSAVIQAIASNKPATDVFTIDEYLKQSFAWSIILDVSGSMKVRGEYSRGLAIAVAEAAKELMTDPSSWTLFAFSDKFYILKDSTESYSQRVRARIGGLKFEGLTYVPDAVYMAGRMLAKRFEEQRVLVAISDGWPYGYDNMSAELKKTVDDLLRKGVIVIGIGVESDLIGSFFRLHSSVYSPKDLVKKFARVFGEASEKALET